MEPLSVYARLTELDRRHAAKVYELIGLRFSYLVDRMVQKARGFGFPVDLPRMSISELDNRYHRECEDWLGNPLDQSSGPASVLALAHFVGVVRADRKLLDMLVDESTIPGEVLDDHHLDIALAAITRWLEERDQENQRAAVLSEERRQEGAK